MKLRHAKRALFLLLASFVAACLMPLAAQEEDAGEDSQKPLGSIWAELEGWIAQANGADLEPATRLDPLNPLGTRVLRIGDATEDEDRLLVGWDLPNSFGTVTMTYYVHEQLGALSGSSPGDFIFGESLAHPFLAGVNNDRLADAFTSNSNLRLRDLRLDFSRAFHQSQKATAKWFVGWRRVQHNRTLDASYYATIPGLPVLLPPIAEPDPQLVPFPDSAQVRSEFQGRGINIGIDLEFPLWKDRIVLEGSVSVAGLRGKTDTSYQSLNSFYVLSFPGQSTILGPPYTEFTEAVEQGSQIPCDPFNPPPGVICVPLANNITQQQGALGVQSDGRSQSAQVLDTEIGFRWRAHKRIEVVGGFRMSRYDNVGTELRATGSTTTLFGNGTQIIDLENVTEEERSITYEGFYGGIRIKLY